METTFSSLQLNDPSLGWVYSHVQNKLHNPEMNVCCHVLRRHFPWHRSSETRNILNF